MPICQICLIAIARAELRPELVIAAMVIAGLVPIVAFSGSRHAELAKRNATSTLRCAQSALCILYSYGDEVSATLAWVGAGKALYGAYSGFLEMVAIAVMAARSW